MGFAGGSPASAGFLAIGGSGRQGSPPGNKKAAVANLKFQARLRRYWLYGRKKNPKGFIAWLIFRTFFGEAFREHLSRLALIVEDVPRLPPSPAARNVVADRKPAIGDSEYGELCLLAQKPNSSATNFPTCSSWRSRKRFRLTSHAFQYSSSPGTVGNRSHCHSQAFRMSFS